MHIFYTPIADFQAGNPGSDHFLPFSAETHRTTDLVVLVSGISLKFGPLTSSE